MNTENQLHDYNLYLRGMSPEQKQRSSRHTPRQTVLTIQRLSH